MAKRIDPSCPYCQATLRPVAMRCDLCDVEIQGEFREGTIQRLAAQDLAFLEDYILAGFSIKALAETSGMGYASIRNRLDRIIEVVRELRAGENQRREILDRLASGEIDAKKAAQMLERIGGNGG